MANQTTKNDPDNRGRDDVQERLRSIWLGMRDSNPRSRDQNPLPYRLANPQWMANMSNIAGFAGLRQGLAADGRHDGGVAALP